MMKQLLYICLALLLSQPVIAKDAKSYQSLPSIQQAAKQYLLEQLDNPQAKIKMASLDSRLKLKKCSEPLEAYPAPGNKTIGRVTVGVRCTAEQHWSLYVAAKITILAKQVVTSRPLTKGHLIQRSDLSVVEKYISNRRQKGYRLADQLIGKQLKRSMQEGALIKPSHIKVKQAIKRGSVVVIRSGKSNINVSMKGKALQQGSIGDIIRVKNLSSKRIVDAIIINNSQVSPI